jgi:hypothetical protein
MHPLPGRIHVFLDLRNIKANMCVSFPISGQQKQRTPPGFYAVIESFDRLYEGNETAVKDQTTFSIFRTYKLTKAVDSDIPVLYLIQLKSIFQPTVGMRDIDSKGNSTLTNRYIFMCNRQFS